MAAAVATVVAAEVEAATAVATAGSAPTVLPTLAEGVLAAPAPGAAAATEAAACRTLEVG